MHFLARISLPGLSASGIAWRMHAGSKSMKRGNGREKGERELQSRATRTRPTLCVCEISFPGGELVHISRFSRCDVDVDDNWKNERVIV